jgi:hypothetical protein
MEDDIQKALNDLEVDNVEGFNRSNFTFKQNTSRTTIARRHQTLPLQRKPLKFRLKTSTLINTSTWIITTTAMPLTNLKWT